MLMQFAKFFAAFIQCLSMLPDYVLLRRFGLALAVSGTSIFSYSPNRCSMRSRSEVKVLRR